MTSQRTRQFYAQEDQQEAYDQLVALAGEEHRGRDVLFLIEAAKQKTSECEWFHWMGRDTCDVCGRPPEEHRASRRERIRAWLEQAVLFALGHAELSEGQACAVLNLDRLALRDLYITWKERQQPLGTDDEGGTQAARP